MWKTYKKEVTALGIWGEMSEEQHVRMGSEAKMELLLLSTL